LPNIPSFACDTSFDALEVVGVLLRGVVVALRRAESLTRLERASGAVSDVAGRKGQRE